MRFEDCFWQTRFWQCSLGQDLRCRQCPLIMASPNGQSEWPVLMSNENDRQQESVLAAESANQLEMIAE